jgi:hypothetical protein
VTMWSRRPLLGASAVIVLLTVALTWPQVLHLRSQIANHGDPYFSAWRLAWIAHALQTDPRRLFDTNIYYPERRTLAYSDATLLEGIVATPLLWAQVPPVLVYNLVLLAGIAASGIGAFVLVRYLCGSSGAALVAAAVFTVAPYRVEHYMHLELQWTIWMPLAFWAAHRTFDGRSLRFGLLTGLFLWLQIISSVYYGIFLAVTLVALGALLAAGRPRLASRPVAYLGAGAALTAALTLPYAQPYLESARMLGPRAFDEIVRYSARPINYLASPSHNWLWGWTGDRFGGSELRLFPGATAIVLALFAFTRRPRGLVWVYGALCALAVEMSFGPGGSLYRWLYAHAWVFSGLRAPGRFSIVAVCALAVLAGFGFEQIERRVTAPRRRAALIAAVTLLVGLEGFSAPVVLEDVPLSTPAVYRFVRSLPPGVMVELPMPTPGTLPGNDPTYQFWSVSHWRPLVNGYSGHASDTYIRTLVRMERFPDADSIARLRALDVRYVLVHDTFYKPDQLTRLMLAIAVRPELRLAGRYDDWTGPTHVFELEAEEKSTGEAGRTER